MEIFIHFILTCVTEITLLYKFCIYSFHSKVFRSDVTKVKASCLRDVSYDFLKTICEGRSFMRRKRVNLTWLKVITEAWGNIVTDLPEVRVHNFVAWLKTWHMIALLPDNDDTCYAFLMCMNSVDNIHASLF